MEAFHRGIFALQPRGIEPRHENGATDWRLALFIGNDELEALWEDPNAASVDFAETIDSAHLRI